VEEKVKSSRITLRPLSASKPIDVPTSTILIVSENKDSLRFQKALIAEHLPSCLVISCQSVSKAEKIISSRPLDGAIIDVRMPQNKGIELCRHVKESNSTKQLSVMLASLNPSSPSLRSEGLDAGADGFINGLLDSVEFIARVRIMLRLKHAEDKQKATKLRLEEVMAEHTAALRSSEERYRRVVEISPDMIIVCADGKTTFVSEAGKEILRASSIEQLVGIPIEDLIHPDSRPDMAQLLSNCLEKGKKIPFLEAKFLAFDGTAIDVETKAVSFPRFGQNHIQLIVRDITERKQMSERFRQAQRMEAVGLLAGGVAHDFNNIITTVRGYTELVDENLDDSGTVKEDLNEIKKATERAAALTRQLLAFSRRQVLEPKALDLNTIVTDMKRMLNRTIGANVEFVTNLDPNLGTIKADRSHIEQVIMNLVVNARDAIETTGKVTISTQNVFLKAHDIEKKQLDLGAGRYALLKISDTGRGMDPETAFRIFEPFFSTKEKGTGLGLSTVYGITKQSGGEVKVSSILDNGSTFFIYLPIVDDRASLNEVSRIEAGVARGWETVLLVEDEKPVRTLATRLLERAGYNVLAACHGREAIQLAQHHDGKIHIILTDVVMPEMGGAELVEHLHAVNPDMRMLFMSGYSNEAVQGINGLFANICFLEKPFSYKELIHKVRSVLDGEPVFLR
jgi:PAS domain S-box-containing protein